MENSADFTSDEASIAFIHHTLCPRYRLGHDSEKKLYHKKRQQNQHRPDANLSSSTVNATPSLSDILPLPPLTSSNAVDIQLYAVLATLVRAFLLPWYRFGDFGDGIDGGSASGGDGRDAMDIGSAGGTDTDSNNDSVDHLIAEVVRLVAHCSRGVEERLRKVDVMALMLDEVPTIVERHVIAFRTADHPMHPTPFMPERRQIYHALNPHPALSPVVSSNSPARHSEAADKQGENDATWRYLLAEGVLSVLLPAEDLENGCLRTFLEEVLADTVLGGVVGGIVSEPAFIWDGIAKVANLVADASGKVQGWERKREQEEERGKTMSASGNLEKYGLLDPVGLEVEEKSRRDKAIQSTTGAALACVSRYFWQSLYIAYILYVVLRAIVLIFATSSSLPRRSQEQLHRTQEQQSNKDHSTRANPEKSRWDGSIEKSAGSLCPIVEMRVWACFGRLLDVEMLMPWVSGLAALSQWMAVHGPGRIGEVDGLLDR